MSTEFQKPFEPAGDGVNYKIAEGRDVSVFPGNGDLVIVWRNHGKEHAIRLTEQAAEVTLLAMMNYLSVRTDKQARHAA